eukprot:SAG31_NODE_2532_length_5555_cov_2.362170_8_plen_92_part_00
MCRMHGKLDSVLQQQQHGQCCPSIRFVSLLKRFLPSPGTGVQLGSRSSTACTNYDSATTTQTQARRRHHVYISMVGVRRQLTGMLYNVRGW